MSSSLTIQPHFGGFVLETLTIGMYGESRNAIREYIQNGFDSVQMAIASGVLLPASGRIELEIKQSEDRLTIFDNGIGLGTSNAVSTLLSVGASAKDRIRSAGFRGIGRLAGIGFCNVLTFTTKAKGEKQKTIVTFDCKRMRELMAPEFGGGMTAENLLRECVTARVEEASDIADHFFVVDLQGMVDAPEECTNFDLMYSFVSQVAPVRYHPDFKFAPQILKRAAEAGLPIETVSLFLSDDSHERVEVVKGYRNSHRADAGDAEITDIQFYPEDHDPKAPWLAWAARRETSGAFDDANVRGMRFRTKNIQIDGSDLFAEVFRKKGKTAVRFQDWAIGEILIRPDLLVPNARRDGFEETPAWRKLRSDLLVIAADLESESRRISNAGQLSYTQLESRVEEQVEQFGSIERAGSKTDRLIEFSAAVTKLQKKVASAIGNADIETVAKLHVLTSELVDIKTRALAKLGATEYVDKEMLREEARDELLAEIISLLSMELDPPCFNNVKRTFRKHFDV